MNNKDSAWNSLATAMEYIQDCDNMIGNPIDPVGQLENLTQAQKYIELATVALVGARRELLVQTERENVLTTPKLQDARYVPT